jgi:succinate dehydrogenase / fumarate reductase cytochrome b subunit
MSLNRIFGSSLGKKYVMAVTGCVLFLFVIFHMLGNLQIFLGPETLNRYGNFLQSNPEIIWPARAGLLLMVALHIMSAIQLSVENKAARPVPYAQYEMVAASYASRTMLMSGVIIFIFIVYHLLHFTVQIPAVNFTAQDFKTLHDAKERHDVYRMMVIGYSNIWVSGFYILGMGLLCLHLSHGVSSMFQSLGWKSQQYSKCLDGFAKAVAVIIFAGNCSIPLAVLFGLIQ